MKISILLCLATLILQACGDKSKAGNFTDIIANPEPKLLDVSFADASFADEISAGKATVSTTKISDGVYYHRVAFKITNRKNTLRCEASVYLQNRNATDEIGLIFGSSKRSPKYDFGSNNCLDPQGTGYVLAFIKNANPDLEEVLITKLDDLDFIEDWQDDKRIEVVAKGISSVKVSATLKNIGYAEGFDEIGLSAWVMVSNASNELVLDWGFLDPVSEIPAGKVIGLGESLEIASTWANPKKIDPGSAEVLIFPGPVSKR